MSNALIGPMRPNFLILTPACVLLGIATAFWSGATLNPLYIVLILTGALMAHISVNALNEYHDFKSGLDLVTEATPFSGGTKTLPNNPTKAHLALMSGIVTIVLVACIGIYFLMERGLWILPVGILGLVIIYTYTPFITRSPFLCLIAPGLGFGPLMVMGTDFILTGHYSWTAAVASLVPFFLVNDLLLLNQFPDVEPDRQFGRDHLLIRIGRPAGARVYVLFLILNYAVIIFGCFFEVLPQGALLGLLTLVLAVPVMRGVVRHADDIPNLIPFMVKNVIINITTPVLVALGLFLNH
ncbi:MAG: prenyltransferase [Smithella sp.]|nr:prenyltransferase [Smithella sp.]MDM7986900.1 prenyltransferase [Smithella sp.]HOU50670.1 prenyltransferase [Smithella sp.]HQG64637.1 prenyltransferase [Smithella sp.]HQI71870.1 prenyltransferase [Smithella sp.]